MSGDLLMCFLRLLRLQRSMIPMGRVKYEENRTTDAIMWVLISFPVLKSMPNFDEGPNAVLVEE